MKSFNFFVSLIGQEVKDTRTNQIAKVNGLHIYIDQNKNLCEPRVYLGTPINSYRRLDEIKLKGDDDNEQMHFNW